MFGIDEPADLFDARTNVALAYQMYLRERLGPLVADRSRRRMNRRRPDRLIERVPIRRRSP